MVESAESQHLIVVPMDNIRQINGRLETANDLTLIEGKPNGANLQNDDKHRKIIQNSKVGAGPLYIDNPSRSGQSPDVESQPYDNNVKTSSTEQHISDLPKTLSRNQAFASSSDPPTRSLPIPHNHVAAATSTLSLNDSAGNRSILRELTPDEELTSLRVRALYSSGVGIAEVESLHGSVPTGSIREGLEQKRLSAISAQSNRSSRLQTAISSARQSTAESLTSLNIEAAENLHSDFESRGEHEYAGGVEDWEDVDGSDIDRYGFIMPKSKPNGSNSKVNLQHKPGHQRMSTALFVKSSQPRKQPANSLARNKRLQILISPFSDSKSVQMLTSPIVGSGEKVKEKEMQRVAKWRNMAKPAYATCKRAVGAVNAGRTDFTFSTTDPKLINRTWKGIPDCWRAAAWFSFLQTSARKKNDSKSNEEMVASYHNLLLKNSADDAQIDLDVPRTISSHIMFRRRYRGGQRLLFRVLHSLSLYFPELGYVQGMASLAATFLCYYDEDATFIMLVRLFELRGLYRLYSDGFGGLMDALNEFDSEWLKPGNPAVSKKLESLGVTALSFGTRWYLTLFNYSVPFAAQLRVWDVFILLGDAETNPSSGSSTGFNGVLDVLHATSAALIDSMKDLILNSDFEGSMKVLTSWIPIKDEDILMKSARAEWKRRKRRKLIGRFPKHREIEVIRPGTSTTTTPPTR